MSPNKQAVPMRNPNMMSILPGSAWGGAFGKKDAHRV
jgi:hypothetical protein